MPLPSNLKPACAQTARILSQAERLPPTLQPVFATWLARHAGRAVSNPGKSALIDWLAGMDPARAEAEFNLILSEIAWLELVTESTQIETLQKEAL